MKLIFDIETNGLLDQLDTVHCLWLRDINTGEAFGYHGDAIVDGLHQLSKADRIIGHNVIGFDLPAIQKVYPWFTYDRSKVWDTLVISRLVYSDLSELDYAYRANYNLPGNKIGSHGLEAWGYRLRLNKGDYSKEMKAKGLDPWAEWNPEMHEYCCQDTNVTLALFKRLKQQAPGKTSIDLEHRVAWLMAKQHTNGFPFDVRKAEMLVAELTHRAYTLKEEITRYLQALGGGSR
jgi:DNA polymerase I